MLVLDMVGAKTVAAALRLCPRRMSMGRRVKVERWPAVVLLLEASRDEHPATPSRTKARTALNLCHSRRTLLKVVEREG